MKKIYGRRLILKSKGLPAYPGTLISLEGISGTGKSHFGKLAVKHLQDSGYKVLFVNDLMKYEENDLGKRIIDILSSTNDKFFRIGFPIIESMLLSSVKLYEMEEWIKPALDSGYIVIEDRSVDTVAIYSAILINKKHPERDIFETYKTLYANWQEWNIIPDSTIYIKGSFEDAIRRSEERNGEQYKADELELLKKASVMYDAISRQYKQRIEVIDTDGLRSEDIVEKIETLCLKHANEKDRKRRKRRGFVGIRF